MKSRATQTKPARSRLDRYRKRSIGSLVRDALAEMPVVVVTGLRQSGKSTFLQHEKGLASRRYVSLDDFAQLAAARSDPEGLVR